MNSSICTKTVVSGCILFIGLVSSNLAAQVVEIDASRDAGYFAAGFDNGIPFVTDRNQGAHTHVSVGRANNDRVNRSVFDFDIVGNVPSGATVDSVTFEFEVSQQGGTANGQLGADFSLHRVTTAWDEGTGVGEGGDATEDGVTWANATAAVLWTTLGGDFDAASLGTDFVDGPIGGEKEPPPPVVYSISSAALVTVVQDMLDGSTTNLGFLLKAVDPEDVLGSAARVTSREGGNPAKLIIGYTADDVLLGDVNLDGVVTLLDVAPFVDRLTTGTYQAEADTNEDGFVTLLDVAPFIDILSGN